MVEAATVPISEKRLNQLESEHQFLELIRASSKSVTAAKAEYDYAKNESLEKKKVLDRLQAEQQLLIEGGPAKPDPQGKFPFVADDAPVANSTGGSTATAEPEVVVPVPAEIEALDLTDKQKQAIAATGAKSLADVSDIANANWPQYPKGLKSVEGLGPKGVERVLAQLPSTAPVVEEKPGQAPSSTVKVELLTMSAASPNLEVGDHYEATMLDDGNVVIQLPNEPPVSFSPGEYRVVSA